MGSRTVYTSIIRVPVYAGWKCPYCNENNFSEGYIACRQQASTTSWRSSKKAEAKVEAENLTKQYWKDNAFRIISQPNLHAQEMRNDLFLQNTKCTKCGKKPEWDKDMKYLCWLAGAIIPAIISGFIAIVARTSIIAWLIFAVFLGVIIYAFYSEDHYKKVVKNLPKNHTPIMGSLNRELVEYAKEKGYHIPLPGEVIHLVESEVYATGNDVYNNRRRNSKEAQPIANTTRICFCRKCGAELVEGGEFCHRCGTKINYNF